MKTKEKRFDVVIKDMKGKIVSVVGRNLSEDRAEQREMMALGRINNSYFADVVPSGSRPLESTGGEGK